MSNTITLKGVPQHNEGNASVAVTPGMLVERVAAGIRPHSVAADNARKYFAVEFDEVGRGVDDVYAIGERVLYGRYASGDEVYALVAAGATAITVGAALESAGDGTLRIQTTDAATDNTERDSVVGYAKEAVDNSGGGSRARIKIEVA